MNVGLALVLAVASAILLDLSYLFQQRSTDRLESFSVRHPALAVRALLSARMWILGALLGIAGFVASLVAIGFADLSLVQAASASGIAVLAIIAAVWFGERLSIRERIGVGVMTIGLVALGLTVDGSRVARADADARQVWVWVAGSLILAAVLFHGAGRSSVSRAALAGIGTGVILGAGRVATKGLIEDLPGGAGFGEVLGSPLLVLTVVVYAAGIWAQSLAFQRGEAVKAISLLVASTSVVPIIAGLVVFHDPLPADPLGQVLRFAGFALVLAGGAVLATRVMVGPAGADEDGPADRGHAEAPAMAPGLAISRDLSGQGGALR